ncbi:MAG: orotidine 5'-phosphate decarboxylase, partial [Bacteroidetes bacterium RIFCSPLOWO2_12_FULL_31_6]
DIEKIPVHLKNTEYPQFEFNKAIIDATADYCVSYKINTAFYECLGSKGWKSLEKTVDYISKDHFIIADAKRGDIGNTSSLYARAFFNHLNVDAITVAPYMGKDSVEPFLAFKNKWVILLALTSNSGAMDFQFLQLEHSKKKLFEKVIIKSKEWGNTDNLMYVVGATQAQMLSEIREIIPDHFLLIPGVGAQGGSLEDVAKYGMTPTCGLLVNSSRSIIYAGSGIDFAENAEEEVLVMQKQMEKLLKLKGIVK